LLKTFHPQNFPRNKMNDMEWLKSLFYTFSKHDDIIIPEFIINKFGPIMHKFDQYMDQGTFAQLEGDVYRLQQRKSGFRHISDVA